MAHQVKVKLLTNVVGRKDLEIIVKSSSGKLGTLLISKGNIEWLPKSKYVNKKQLTWQQFADAMMKLGKSAKKKA